MTKPRRQSQVLLDTGPLYGLLDDKDGWHPSAVALFEQLEAARAEVLCAYPAALETHRLMLTKTKAPVERIHALIDGVLEAFGVEYPVADDGEAARANLRRYGDQRISLTDATIAAMARRIGAQAVTFDARHFGLMGAEVYSFEGMWSDR